MELTKVLNGISYKSKGDLSMKATGIVRRIEEYGIIGQTARNPHKHYRFC